MFMLLLGEIISEATNYLHIINHAYYFHKPLTSLAVLAGDVIEEAYSI